MYVSVIRTSDFNNNQKPKKTKMRVICCGRGELILRSCFWVWWYVGAALPKIIETFVFVWPVHIIEAIILDQWAETIAGGLLGVFMSYAMFLPLADSSSQVYPGGICSFYVCVFSWVVGAFVTSFVIDLHVIEPLRHSVFEGSRWFRRVRSGAWLGVAIGLSFAFSITLIVHPLPSQVQPFEQWCRPHPTFPLPVLAIPVGLFGALAHMVDVPSFNKIAARFRAIREQQQNNATMMMPVATRATSTSMATHTPHYRPAQYGLDHEHSFSSETL